MNAAKYSLEAKQVEETQIRDELVEEIAAFLELSTSGHSYATAIRERFLSTSTERSRYPDAT